MLLFNKMVESYASRVALEFDIRLIRCEFVRVSEYPSVGFVSNESRLRRGIFDESIISVRFANDNANRGGA